MERWKGVGGRREKKEKERNLFLCCELCSCPSSNLSHVFPRKTLIILSASKRAVLVLGARLGSIFPFLHIWIHWKRDFDPWWHVGVEEKKRIQVQLQLGSVIARTTEERDRFFSHSSVRCPRKQIETKKTTALSFVWLWDEAREHQRNRQLKSAQNWSR